MDERAKSDEESEENGSTHLDDNQLKNFELEIKNFGPIKSGLISIKPLTIFVGPNQSGKSYAAMLIYSIYKSQERISKDDSLMNTFYDLATTEDKEKLTSIFNNLSLDHEIEISSDMIQKVFSMTYQKAYENKLNEEIARTFASPLNNLIFLQEGGKKFFSFKIFESKKADHGDLTSVIYRNNRIQISQFPNYKVEMRLKIAIKKENLFERILESIKKQFAKDFEEENKEILADNEEKIRKDFGYYPAYFFIVNAIRSIISSKYARCYYLPAARSGILQGHEALFTSIIRLAPYAGENKMEIPTLSGVVSDFINSMVIIPKEKGPLYKLARQFEDELIYGKITINKQEKFSYPEIGYVFKNIAIPIHRASSTVSELAPIFLYLKYIVNPHNVLIIEEPEAHLHPLNQRILAKLIVHLIRNDVRVIITTHSDYLLEQINNYILVHDINEKTKSERYNFDSKDYLKPDEVSAHVFRYEENKGNKVIQLKIDKKTGIPMDEFSMVTESLYKESVKIQRDINN